MFLSSFYIFFSSFLKVYLNCTVNLELRGGVGGGGGGKGYSPLSPVIWLPLLLESIRKKALTSTKNEGNAC